MQTKLRVFLAAYFPFILAFLLCELIFVWGHFDWVTSKGFSKLAIFYVLIALLTASINVMASRVLLYLFLLAEVTQLYYFTYFKRQPSAADFSLGMSEMHDTAQSLLGMWQLFIVPTLIVAGIIALLFLSNRYSQSIKKRWWPFSIVIIILIVNAYKISTKPLENASPEHRTPAILNAINAWSAYITHFVLFDEKAMQVSYKPYVINREHVDFQPNILLFIGESLNPRHMSVLNYTRETTPKLQQLITAKPSAMKRIFSAGVFTRVATPMFLGVVREPDNINRYRTSNGHLVSEAKRQGYQTLLVSTQTLDFMASTAVMSDYDRFIDWQTNRDFTEENFPSYLRGLSLPDDKPWFVVLNTRAPHSPYKEHIMPALAKYSLLDSESLELELVNEYDDGVRTADFTMAAAIDEVMKKTSRPTLVVITSDHGQLVNRDGEFGHGRLDMDVAEIPLIIVGVNWPKNAPFPDIRCVANHYELGRKILQVMGVQLINPNKNNNMYYLNGSNLYGRGGVIEYEESCTAVSHS